VSRLLRIGTRGSRLALWQAHAIADRLAGHGGRSEIVVIKTTGDRSQTGPTAGDDTKRQFVKEIEDALLDKSIDIAVHSAKDMTALLPSGLAIGACLPREDPSDAIVLPGTSDVKGWPAVAASLNGVIGTGSVRRTAQLAPLLPRASFAPIRGNVDTRVAKVDRGEVGALVLAAAGLRRLGLGGRISAAIPIDRCVPAPGQGIVATEVRTDDEEAGRLLGAIHDETAGRALEAERALISELGGGCQLPLGAIALPLGADLEMHAVVASRDGAQIVRRSLRGPQTQAAELGRRLAEALAQAGARDLLRSL
jgi:hydroxymethylbilane synthase